MGFTADCGLSGVSNAGNLAYVDLRSGTSKNKKVGGTLLPPTKFFNYFTSAILSLFCNTTCNIFFNTAVEVHSI